MTVPVTREPLAAIAARVLRALPTGRDNRKSAEQLQDEAGVECERRTSIHVRKAIRFLVNAGHPICSNSFGYWLESNPKALRKYACSLVLRALSIQIRADAINAAADRAEGGAS